MNVESAQRKSSISKEKRINSFFISDFSNGIIPQTNENNTIEIIALDTAINIHFNN